MRNIIVLVVLAWSLIAAAQIASADPRHEADDHNRRGVALYNLGKYEASIDEFEQAYTLFQSDALLFNLAQAHRQLQHCERALYYYTRFLEGSPSQALASQVERLLPKLEAACRTKLEPPAGPVNSPAPAETALGAISPLTSSAPGPTATRIRAPAVVARAQDDRAQGDDAFLTHAATPEAPRLFITGAMSVGVVVAGKAAPATSARLTVTTPLAWLGRGELGGAVAIGQLWRGAPRQSATLAQLTATIPYHAVFDWGRLTIAGELGAAYFSSLDYSGGVVPGVTAMGQWIPLARAELGAEHDVGHSLALRVGVAMGVSPRMGPFLTAIDELELSIGLRYER